MFEEGVFLAVGVGDGHGQGPELEVGSRLLFLNFRQIECYTGKNGKMNGHHSEVGEFKSDDRWMACCEAWMDQS